MSTLTLSNWRERIGSLVSTALDATYRERAMAMGQGYAVWHVPHTTRLVVMTEPPNSDPWEKVLDLRPSWNNPTALREIMTAMERRPLPFA